MTAWHVTDDDLATYAAGTAAAPVLWSTETHLTACAACRGRLAAAVDLDTGWARLDARLDAPRPGLVEAALLRLRVPAHTARLLACTPALRRSWLVAVALTLAVTAALVHLTQEMAVPIPLLAVAPLLPLAGVAISFGPRVDPTHELTVVAPIDTFRLLLLRCAAVLVTTTALTAVASLALPESGPVVLGWLVPALALTLLALALTPRLGPVPAAVAVGAGWAVLVAATVRPGTGGSVLFSAPGQGALATAAVFAAAAVWKVRSGFDIDHHLGRAS